MRDPACGGWRQAAEGHDAAIAHADRDRSVRLAITGMTCPMCAGEVEQALRWIPGVVSALVRFVAQEATVEVDGVPVEVLIDVLADAGYSARQVSDDADLDEKDAAEGVLRRMMLRTLSGPAVVRLPADRSSHLERLPGVRGKGPTTSDRIGDRDGSTSRGA